MLIKPRSRILAAALALAGALGGAVPAQSGQLSVATDPLGTGTSSIKPNVMFILDDSGSMGSDYMPDYVNDSHNPTSTTAGCYDAGDDSSGTIDGTPDACVFGDSPFNSPDFNTIYYNPAIRYRPGLNADGSEMPNQDSATTTGWTAVRTDPYQSTSTANILTGFNDRVWCASTADAAGGGNCRQNSAYTFPNASFPYGKTSGGSVKYLAGSPYVYRMQSAQWCTTAARTTCVSGSSVGPSTHTFQAPEFCSDEELTNCVATLPIPATHVFSGVRWCDNNTTMTNCQRKKIGAFIYAKHLGTTTTGTVPAQEAEGNIQVSSVLAAGGTINTLTIGGAAVISAPITVAAGATPIGVAAQITTAINAGPLAATYLASQNGSNVVIKTLPIGNDGSAFNGRAISVTPNGTGTTSARGVITISTASVGNLITSVTVNGQQLLTCTPATGTPVQTSPVNFTSSSNTSQWIAGSGTGAALSHIRVNAGSSSNTRRTMTRNALVAAINACGSVNPPYGTAGWTASNNGSYSLNIIAPVSLGATPNNSNIVETGSVSTTICTPAMGVTCGGGVVGVTQFSVTTTTASMSGGAATFSGVVRIGTGQFQRTDIVPANDSYVKGANRSDCAGSACTYAEEMTNFANWYAYARTRMHMMKGAVGHAFTNVSSAYRVGFITICPVTGVNCSSSSTGSMGYSVVSSKYLKIAAFDTTHRDNWYTKLYNTDPANYTPLREALSRVGLIYAGQFGSGLTGGLTAATDDPVTDSCQPNFAILSTDGYWNGGPGRKTDNSTTVGNQDNSNSAPYSLQSDGVYDGGTPTASDTLADVALYYYQTDLRPTLSATVPTTNKDRNGEQHMVTFTIGLGLDGQLTYRSDYETATSGDFFNIKQGSIKWPVPASGAPSSLDDLWHAAVNGRGVFFSAKNPDQVANGLSDTLEQLQTRVGAGAAAATSNLQPVAGDNFAFTAQYQTNDWIGDLKARTIDLNSGIVSSVQLWSAAELLDATVHTGRRVFTYDSGDTSGAFANRMKHLCMPADVGAAWCNDGTGLTAAEQNYFDPALIALAQEGSWTTAGSTQSLVNYIRGDNANYNTGTSPRLATDLYRTRISSLGDIVNAQPAYVKKTPFSYTDTGYATFKACTEGTGSGCPVAQFPDPANPRRGTVFAASNDGMLHAFETDVNNAAYYQTAGITTAVTGDDTFTGNNAGNGAERWAYIPAIVLPTIHSLADEPYVHRYYVDGSPTVGDICTSTPCAGLNDWRTILVAGLNSGGRGYYALDITNPAASSSTVKGVKALWEFGYTSSCVTVGALGVPTGGPFYGDCHVGLSYGNPIITKRTSDGKWVVIVTSGYNNGSVDGNGNGQGYLYILDAATGQILHRLGTASGTAGSPSGLAKINGWTLSGSTNNSTVTVYGGDLNGNLWRFDLDYNGGVNTNFMGVTKVAQVVDDNGVAQPITVRPELGEYAGKRIVLFGTGKFLEAGDKTGPFTQQTIYALRDEPATVTSPVISNVRDTALVKHREFEPGSIAGTRTVTAGAAPNWATEFGWLIDLPDTGERVNVDPQLQLGTLVVASNVPTTDTCTAGGISYLNYLDYATGSYIPGATGNMASVNVGSSLTVGINVVMLPGGKVVTIATTAANQQLTQDTPVVQGKYQSRRVSWRELIVE